jgi:hypothetical protein
VRRGAHNQSADASDCDLDAERFDRSLSANIAQRVGERYQQSRPPWRRDCRNAAHTEG